MIQRLFPYLYWLILALGTTITGLPLLQDRGSLFDFGMIVPIILIIVWSITILLLLPEEIGYIGLQRIRKTLCWLPRWLRQRPTLWWLGILVGLIIGFGWWGLLKHTPVRKEFYSWAYLWGLAFLFTAGLTQVQLREMAQNLRNSRWTGFMMSLTTVIVVLLGIEFAMRNYMIYSDNFGFSLMNAHWFNTYWKPVNSQGYRDYEIEINVNEDVQRILIVGDSFAAGHGVNNIDDTFPQMLKNMLGEGYTVNLVAKPGWQTDNQITGLASYPVEADIVILAYYLNDMADLDARAYDDEVAQIFPLPRSPFVANFYLPNFLYWHIYLQLIQSGEDSFNNLILDVYEDENLWEQQQERLNDIITIVDEKNAQLLAVVWSPLTGMQHAEVPAQMVVDYFAGQGISVINMLDDLRDQPPGILVVNPFDSHPNAETHRLAAERLYDMVIALNTEAE